MTSTNPPKRLFATRLPKGLWGALAVIASIGALALLVLIIVLLHDIGKGPAIAMHLADEARSSPELWEPSYDEGIRRKRDRLLLAPIPLSRGKWIVEFPSDPSWTSHGFTVDGPSTLYLAYAAWRVRQHYNEQAARRFSQ